VLLNVFAESEGEDREHADRNEDQLWMLPGQVGDSRQRKFLPSNATAWGTVTFVTLGRAPLGVQLS
jgi:hypothetical protein